MVDKATGVNAILDHTRVMSVLDEFLKKLKFLDSLKANVSSDINMIQGEEMQRLLKEQNELETRYAWLLEQAESLKGLADKSKLQEVKKEIDEINKKIKETTKNMWKILQDNPDVADNKEKISKNKTELETVLDKAYKGLLGDNLEEYKTYVESEKAGQERLDKLKHEEKELVQYLKKTTQELNNQKNEFAAEEERIKKEIKDLKQELQKEKLEKELRIHYAEKQRDGELACVKRMNGDKEAQTQKVIDELKKQEVNSAILLFYRKTKGWLVKKFQSF